MKIERIELKKYKLSVLEVVFLSIALGFMFLTMFYADLTVTAQFSLTLIDSLFDGKFASFYNNALAMGIAPEGAVYDIGIYLVLAVWGIPVWILKSFLGIDVLSIGSLLWFKLLLVFFAIGCGIIIGKIAEEIDVKKEYAEKMWIFSLLFIFPVFVAAQYDIIPLLFMLNAILYAIRGNMKYCIVNFAIAFTMKPFALMTFLVVVLIKEKNIFKIAKDGIISIIPLAICKIIYMLNPVNNASNNTFLASMFGKLLEIGIDVGNGRISLFCLFLFIICIAAYLYESKNEPEKDGKWIIWLLYLTWMNFCVFTSAYPYWIIYMAPFMVLVVLYDELKLNFLLVMDLIINVGIIAIMTFRYSWVYGGTDTFSYLILKPWRNIKEDVGSIGNLLSILKLDTFIPTIYAIVLGALLVVAYIGYIHMKKETVNAMAEEKINKLHWWIRIIFLYGWCAVCILLLLIAK